MHLYVFDIDGTLAHTPHHRPHSCKGTADSFLIMRPDRVATDTPYANTVEYVRSIRCHAGPDTMIYLLTGRPETARRLTEAWCLIHGVPYDELFMVGTAECRPSADNKAVLLKEWTMAYETITVVDDDPAVGKHCARLGIGFIDAKAVRE